MIPDWELPARRLYEWLNPHAADGFRVRWEDLTDAERLKYGHAAMRVAASAPAPIVVSCQHIMPFPHSGMGKHIYADVTKESIDKAVEEFRMFLTNLADDWRRDNEGG